MTDIWDKVYSSDESFFGENTAYDYKDTSPETLEILPVNFGTEHKQILSHLYMMINKGYLAVPEKYDKLIVSLRTAQARVFT